MESTDRIKPKGRIKNNLSKILGEKRISRRQLSLITGIRGSTISDIYHEKAKVISLENIALILEALDIGLNEFLEYIPEEKK